MLTPICVTPSGNPSNAATNYLGFGAGVGWVTSESQAQMAFSQPGTVSNLTIYAVTDPGAGSFAVSFRKAGATQSGTTVTLDTSNRKVTSAGSFTVAAGDKCNLMCVPTGSPTTGLFLISFTFTGTNAGKGVLFSWITIGTTSLFFQPGGNGATTETNVVAVMPCDGTFDEIYVNLSAAVGAGATRVFTVRKWNGSAFVDTSLTKSIDNSTTLPANAATSVSFVQGDLITIAEVCSTSPAPATASVMVCLTFTPSVDGETPIIGGCSNSAVNGTAARYLGMASRGSDTSTEDTTLYGIMPVAGTFKKQTGYSVVAPGSGKSRTFALLKGTANPLTAQAASAAVTTTNTASDNVNTVSVAALDFVGQRETPAGTPSGSLLGVSAVFTAAVAAGPPAVKGGGLMMMGCG